MEEKFIFPTVNRHCQRKLLMEVCTALANIQREGAGGKKPQNMKISSNQYGNLFLAV